jgi:cytochrome P450
MQWTVAPFVYTHKRRSMTIQSLDIDFYSDEVIGDPYPVYERMREIGPVVYLQRHDLYALPRYREVSEVLRQPLRFVSSRGVSPIPKVNDILVGSTTKPFEREDLAKNVRVAIDT